MSKKIFIIIRSEFLRRFTSKTFILTTLLAPALLVGLIMVTIVGISSTLDKELEFNDTPSRIAIIDDTGVLGKRILLQDHSQDLILSTDLELSQRDVQTGALDAYIHIPSDILSGPHQPTLYFLKATDFLTQTELRSVIERSLEDYLLMEVNVTAEVRNILDRSVQLETVYLEHEDSVDVTNSSVFEDEETSYVVLATLLSMIMYMMILIYGSQILYGVIEERTTRIVEIIISSVRPFELMMGKVLGIGMVGLAQLFIWVITIVGGFVFMSQTMALFFDPVTLNEASLVNQLFTPSQNPTLPNLSVSLIIWYFLFVIGGYLLYGGLFAAIGTLVDSPQESQTFIVPLMVPLIIPMAFLSLIILSPDSDLAVGLSIFPLTSPVPMAVRLTIGSVPVWQTFLSYGLLIFSVIGSIWGSSKIYRARILMYGKKPSFKAIYRYLRLG